MLSVSLESGNANRHRPARETMTDARLRTRTAALNLWRRELAAGERTRSTFDALWRAACADMNALESAAIPHLATAYRQEAQRILTDAVKRERAGAA
jgi:hypothetical protein